MVLDKAIRRCVAYLVVDSSNPDTMKAQRRPVGTVFFVSIPLIGDPEKGQAFAVTARHLIDLGRASGALYLRVNSPSGAYVDQRMSPDEWVTHPTNDVAICRVEFEMTEHLGIPVGWLADEEFVAKAEIGVGDELFFVGLFTVHPGQRRNEPVVRFGRIARMPEEPVPVKLGHGVSGQIETYLAEVRSWGGHSGSPVFVAAESSRVIPQVVMGGHEISLLGLLQGHFDIKEDVEFQGDILGSGRVPVNAGIGIVVPAKAVLEGLRRNNMRSGVARLAPRLGEGEGSGPPYPSGKAKRSFHSLTFDGIFHVQGATLHIGLREKTERTSDRSVFEDADPVDNPPLRKWPARAGYRIQRGRSKGGRSLKTARAQALGGSNPSPSAEISIQKFHTDYHVSLAPAI